MTTEQNEPRRGYRHYLEMVTGSLEQKKRYKQYKARVQRLPAGHGEAVEALQRYMSHFGPGDSESLVVMLEDLVDLFEQSAADGTSIREIVGENPVEFAEEFLRNYPDGQWIGRERERLTKALDDAARDET
ncbi:hypothetical protein DP939_06540 [Spongiactinospora rosea]|uniref:DNA-binding ferritin-like protein (Dps family) n=1 Tax=Spongiactinospora rosea TaxID=2248750 RepID=A0A366M5M1_9ACTN|nr:DUF1048 domain-containing protein [Spongiactinospora rosea]RBQ20732.1 hypothetical protein DP939_06540 [Spongiactinospora rosea]